MLNTIIYIGGVIFWIGVLFILGSILKSKWDWEGKNLIRKYNDYCYLGNIDMTEKDFNKWIDETTAEERKKHPTRSPRWYYSWIPMFKLKSKKKEN